MKCLLYELQVKNWNTSLFLTLTIVQRISISKKAIKTIQWKNIRYLALIVV